MKRLVLAAALSGAALTFLNEPVLAHGGQYRGPGDTVPPGNRGGRKPTSPNGPSSGNPNGPGIANPTSPGPYGGPSPGGGPGIGPGVRGSGGGDIGPDLTAWTFWWEFNKEPYLNLKAHIHASGPRSGDPGWWLGEGHAKGVRSQAPSAAQIQDRIVPALLEALENETNNDIVTGCLIALARIGEPISEGGSTTLPGAIAALLESKVQEIQETAAVSLGILGHDQSLELLSALLRDGVYGQVNGRELVGGGEVSVRTRSFAAYGLGLLGSQTANEEVRREIVAELARTLRTDETRSRDLSVACLIALGLVPLETAEPEEPSDEIVPQDSPVSQMEFLLELFQSEDYHYLTRAHAPVALARLWADLPAEYSQDYKERIVELLLAQIGPKSDAKNEVVQGTILALGLLGDADDDPEDAAIREALLDVRQEFSDRLARNFSLIALAKIGGNVEEGRAIDGARQASKEIQHRLAKGKTQTATWSAVASGVLGRELKQADVANSVVTDLAFALRTKLQETKSANEIGAYAIGAGILGDLESAPVLRAWLSKKTSDEARGYCAVALGLMDERNAVEEIRALVEESRRRPELLKQAAVALGLLGDRSTVDDLIVMLEEADSLSVQAALASALGFIGDARSVGPLVRMLENEELTGRARGFAAVALGIVADKAELPWNTRLSCDLNYPASTETLNSPGSGTGILNIL